MMWQPLSLYNISLQAVAYLYDDLNNEFEIYPPAIHFDIIYKLFELARLQELSIALSSLDTVSKLLKVTNKHVQLHVAFQGAMNRCFNTRRHRISSLLAEEYENRCVSLKNDSSTEINVSFSYEQGISVGTFLSEAGWYYDSQHIFSNCLNLVNGKKSPSYLIQTLNCCVRLLNAQNGYCLFDDARRTYQLALTTAEKLEMSNEQSSIAILYAEISAYYMLLSDYHLAYEWGVLSVKELTSCQHLNPVAAIDVMRQAGKACVLKREYKKASLLIKQAAVIAKEMLGENHPKYADTLIDYGFYLLNIDAIDQGIEVYNAALQQRQRIFEGVNLHVAIAHEDFSYASYVYHYSRGTFEDARNQAEKAITLLLQILPSDHFLLSSSKRVKALILEEMAIDSPNKDVEAKLLKDAHELHLDALSLALRAFGEMNVQTAKHYGNLGRLHQSMREFEKAEEMHLKAIDIKEKLLGPDDYEVALSVGHLASLYNYDMCFHSKAEKLYLRSIEIGKKLFGEAYSGLEYDYRGLLKVYTTQCDVEKRTRYLNILRNWRMLREKVHENVSSPLSSLMEPINVELTIQEFFS